MANITSYPTATPTGSDLVIGTDMSTTPPSTKAFTIDSINSLGVASYKVYTALLTQTGTAAPVATILENTTGETITWSRTSTGVFVATISGAVFTVDKTIVFFNNGDASPNTNKWTRTSDTVLTLTIGIDAALANGSFEVRVYS